MSECSLDALATEIRGRLGPAPAATPPPQVSIVVPTHDGAELLRRMLDGLAERTDYAHWELIVVDNASSDGTSELLQEEGRSLPLSVVVNEANESFSDACNQGAALAGGELLLFMNNDVEPFESGWLQELVACTGAVGDGAVAATLVCRDEEHGRSFRYGYGVQHRGHSFQPEDGRRVPVLRGWEADPLDEALGEDMECDAVGAACLMVPRAAFEQVGGFSGGYFYGCEDVDLCLKLRAAGMRIVCSGRSIAVHHPVSTRRRVPFEQARRVKLANRQLLWERWGPQLDGAERQSIRSPAG